MKCGIHFKKTVIQEHNNTRKYVIKNLVRFQCTIDSLELALGSDWFIYVCESISRKFIRLELEPWLVELLKFLQCYVVVVLMT